MKLSKEHRNQLAESWLTPELCEEAGLETLTPEQGQRWLRFQKHGEYGGIGFPYRLPGKTVRRSARVRLDVDEKAKYLGPPAEPPLLYFPPIKPKLLQNVKVPIVFTEGEKKTLALYRLSLHPEREQPWFVPIGLAGVYGWRGKVEQEDGTKKSVVLPDFDRIKWHDEETNRKRTAYICFDTDVYTNKHVQQARIRLSLELQRRDASVWWLRLPRDAPKSLKGVDDFLAHEQYGPAALVEWLPELDIDGASPIMMQTRERKMVPNPAKYKGGAAYFSNTEPFAFGKHMQALVPPEHNDTGNAERFVIFCGDIVVWHDNKNSFFVWDNRRWKADDMLEVRKLSAYSLDETERAAERAAGDTVEKKALAKWLFQSRNSARLTATIEVAKPMLAKAPASFNKDDGWLLNCLNGTLDLRSGILQRHERHQRITKLAPVSYDPKARSDLWRKFINETFPDKKLRYFVQMIFGSVLVGTYADEFFVMQGEKDTGKSTLASAIEAMLGPDYAVTIADVSTLSATTQPGAPRADLAGLEGLRFVNCPETEKNRKLMVSLLKRMTGGDMIAARTPYAKADSHFPPTWKIFIPTNYAILLPDDTDAAVVDKRLIVLPFEHTAEEVDTDLKPALREDPDCRAAILSWAVRGCERWQRLKGRLGDHKPPAVLEAIEQYKAAIDPTRGFFEDRLDFTNPKAWTSANELWENYKAWCEDNRDVNRLDRHDFTSRLKREGCQRLQRRGEGSGIVKAGWKGVSVVY